MAASNRLVLCLAPLVLAGCAAAPVPPPSAAAPLVSSSGLVIGTMSYQYVEVSPGPSEQGWVMHFERLDTPAADDYAMAVDFDPRHRSGFFTGALPAGVYAFREAASAQRRFAAGLKMPFEVQAGAVQDAGHYALNPLLSRR